MKIEKWNEKKGNWLVHEKNTCHKHCFCRGVCQSVSHQLLCPLDLNFLKSPQQSVKRNGERDKTRRLREVIQTNFMSSKSLTVSFTLEGKCFQVHLLHSILYLSSPLLHSWQEETVLFVKMKVWSSFFSFNPHSNWSWKWRWWEKEDTRLITCLT